MDVVRVYLVEVVSEPSTPAPFRPHGRPERGLAQRPYRLPTLLPRLLTPLLLTPLLLLLLTPRLPLVLDHLLTLMLPPLSYQLLACQFP